MMNERIRELVAEAGATLDQDFYQNLVGITMGPQELEEFAKLIVKECIGIVAKRKDQAIDDSWHVDEAMSMAEMDLVEHFGVE